MTRTAHSSMGEMHVPKFVVTTGDDAGLTLEMTKEKDVLICGRRDEAGLKLSDSLVSSQHFRIVKRGETLTLTDLESRNGVLVNDKPVKTTKLAVGDTITVGTTRIEVRPSGAEGIAAEDGAPTFSAFELIDRLGAGGMGVVYKARQLSLDRIVALKVLSKKFTKDRTFVKKFIREARAAGSLTHANVVQVHDVGEEGGHYYICMEYVPGGTLGDQLKREGSIDIPTAVNTAKDVARGLLFAEGKGIVHCDIKPDNIMLTATGDAKIADLGIAMRASDTTGKTPTEVFGSPHYMAPEQAQGKPLDHRTDLYALGCTLFRILAGRTLFSAPTSREVMKMQVAEVPPDLADFRPDAPPALCALVRKLLAKDPAERFQSASEILKVLESIPLDAPAPAPADVPPEGGGAQKKRAAPGTPSPKASATPARKQTAIRGAPARREGGSTQRVRRSHTSQSSAFPFLPVGIGVLLLGIGLAVAYSNVKPDPAVNAYRRAVQYYQAGQFNEALGEIRLRGGTTNKELARQIFELRLQIEHAQLQVQTDARWNEAWNEYIRMRNASASREKLHETLRDMRNRFIQRQYREVIDDELRALLR